MIKTTRS